MDNPLQLELSIIIPAFNEEGNINTVIEQIRTGLFDAGLEGKYEIIIVDDGSLDQSSAEIEQLANQFSFVYCIHHQQNRGLGTAIRTGFSAARGELVTFLPADGEINISETLNLLQIMEDADLVVSRRLRNVKWYRDIFTKVYYLFSSLILGFNVDGIEGVYILRRDLLEKITITSSTGLANLEVLMQCFRMGCSVKYGVMHASPRLSGKSKITNLPYILKNIWEMVRLRMNLLKK